jgi:hypothetical protein
MDLRITHERWGGSSDPSINGHLRYPNDIVRSLNEDSTDKIRKYRTASDNHPPNTISFIPVITSTSGRIHSEFVFLLSLQVHRETDHFFQIQEFNFHNITVSVPLPPHVVLLVSQIQNWEHSHY